MAVLEGINIPVLDFIECLAHLLDELDSINLLPQYTFGNNIVQPGNLVIRAFVNFTVGALIVYDLNYNEVWIDLGECVEYFDTDGKSNYDIDGLSIIIQTKNRDKFIIKFETNQ